jgi:hypothetical protein
MKKNYVLGQYIALPLSRQILFISVAKLVHKFTVLDRDLAVICAHIINNLLDTMIVWTILEHPLMERGLLYLYHENTGVLHIFLVLILILSS